MCSATRSPMRRRSPGGISHTGPWAPMIGCPPSFPSTVVGTPSSSPQTTPLTTLRPWIIAG